MMELPTMQEVYEAIKLECFPYSDDISPQEIRVMRRVVDIDDLPIELKANAFYKHMDGRFSPVTVDNLRRYYLSDSDYQYYVERFDDEPFDVGISTKQLNLYLTLLSRKRTKSSVF